MNIDPETAVLLQDLIRRLDAKADAHPSNCSCDDCCDCTTVRTFEHSATRFNELQAFSAAESTKAFVQQQSAQFAQLLKLQYDTTNKAIP